MEDRLSRTFEALADPARLAVVRLLRKKPRRSSEIAEALYLKRPATSKHLEVLRQAGLVEHVERKHGGAGGGRRK